MCACACAHVTRCALQPPSPRACGVVALLLAAAGELYYRLTVDGKEIKSDAMRLVSTWVVHIAGTMHQVREPLRGRRLVLTPSTTARVLWVTHDRLAADRV